MGDVKVGDCLGQSDHEIEFSILGAVRRVTSKTAILNFQRADFDLFRTFVAGVPWELLFKGKGVQQAWMLLKMEILKAQEQNTPLVIQVETVRELLLHLDCHKSMGPDELHPKVLRELAGMIAEPLSTTYQCSWLSG